MRAYSPRTVQNTGNSLRLFIDWCAERSLGRPGDITRPILERYQRHLFLLRKPDGKPLTVRSQHVRLVAIRGFFKWLVAHFGDGDHLFRHRDRSFRGIAIA